MKKLFKSKKALSPVVAAIILIAVTVAVSIAVAAWMGALTFTFMATEQVAFTGCTYDTNRAYADITVKNTGTAILTIDRVLVNNQGNGTITAVTLNPGGSSTLRIYVDGEFGATAGIDLSTTPDTFVQGANYAFTVVTSKNNQLGPYTKSAPS